MPLDAPALVQPTGLLPTNLVPRTPDEVSAYEEDRSGYENDTDKTAAYVGAFLTAAYADSRVDGDDERARLYAYWRAYDARAQAIAGMPRKGSVDAEGSYEFSEEQLAEARRTAQAYQDDFLAAVSDPDPADDYAGWPRVRSLR